MKKLVLVGLLLIASTSSNADEGFLGAILKGVLQPQSQLQPEGTLVRDPSNGQEYILIQQQNGQSFIQPVYVQRPGQGQYINN